MRNEKLVEKTLLWNIFFREFSTNLTIIYVGAEFIMRIGQESWPLISQYVQYFALLFIVLVAFTTKKIFYRSYLLQLICYGIAVLSYMYAPMNELFLVALIVTGFATGVIGQIVSTNLMTKLTTPIQYKALSPRILTYKAMGNIFGALFVIILQRYGNSSLFSALLFITVCSHFFTYLRAIKFAFVRKMEKRLYEGSVLLNFTETVRYASKTPMIIAAFILIVWSQVAKFYTDWLYISSSAKVFETTESLSTFLSFISFILTGGVFIFGRGFAKKTIQKYSPSNILLIIPLLFLVLGVVGLSTKSYYVGIILNIVFLFLFKTIHTPTLQICLQTAEKEFKGKVFLLLNFAISVIILLFTSYMLSIKDSFSIELLYYSIISLAAFSFLVIFKFDRFYLKNLQWGLMEQDHKSFEYEQKSFESWRKRELPTYFNPHNYFVTDYRFKISQELESFLESIYYFPEDDISEELEHIFRQSPLAFEKYLIITNIYIFSKNTKSLERVSALHKKLLASEIPEDKEKAIQAFFLMGYFRDELIDERDSVGKAISDKIKPLYDHLLSALNRNRYPNNQLFIFALINWQHVTPVNQEKLLEILSIENNEDVSYLAKNLALPSTVNVKHDLLRSFSVENRAFDKEELIKRYFSSREKRRELRFFIYSLRVDDKERVKLRSYAYKEIKKLKSPSENDIIDSLFIVEWLSLSRSEFRFILDSFYESKPANPQEKEYWLDFHCEYLKKAKESYMLSLLTQLRSELKLS